MNTTKSDLIERDSLGPVAGEAAAALRGRLVAGEFPPAAKLPKRSALAAELGVSNDALQRAMATLVADGFLEARQKAGTFVVERPPHLYHYGLALQSWPGDQLWSRYFDAVELAAQQLSEAGPAWISVYRGVGAPGESEGFQRLLRDVESRRLAGLLVAYDTDDLFARLRLAEYGIPALTILGRAGQHGGTYQVSKLFFEPSSFVEQALESLLAQGRRRVAVISLAKHEIWESDTIARAFAKHAVPLPPRWHQAVSPLAPEWGENLVHLLFSGPPSTWPDGLLVTDDNIVAPVARGLEACGVRIPDQVAVVAHYNHPLPLPSDLPFDWLGYDQGEILAQGIDMLAATRQAAGAAVSQEPIRTHWLGSAMKMDKRMTTTAAITENAKENR